MVSSGPYFPNTVQPLGVDDDYIDQLNCLMYFPRFPLSLNARN